MLSPHSTRGQRARIKRRAAPFALAGGVALVATGALPALAGPSPQRTVRIRSVAKGQPGGPSANPRISGDGRFVAFASQAANLGPADPNGDVSDVYLYDGNSAQIRLLSSALGGAGADGPSSDPAISADGGVVAFFSIATNLVPRASNVDPAAAPHGDVFAWSHDGGLAQASVSSSQVPANGDSREPDVSADGRMIAFSSTATNLTDGHPAAQRDVYVRDTGAATTALVSATPDGQPGDGDSSAPGISPDGRFVSFSSTATNLVTGTVTHGTNVFIRDLVAGTTELVSISRAGAPVAGGPATGSPAISHVSTAGRFVVFDSPATNLVRGDTNHHTDVFVRDRTAKTTIRASVATTDQQADGDSLAPSITPDGRYVTFVSQAPNLTPGQPPGINVFVRDQVRHTTVMADVSSGGRPRGRELAGRISQAASTADDGSTTVFVSSARNLVADKRTSVPDIFLRRLTPAPISIASSSVRLVRGHVVVTFLSTDRGAGGLLCRLDHQARAICPLGGVVLPLLAAGKHVLTAYAGGPGSAYALRPTTVRIVVRRGGRARVKVKNPGSALGIG